MIEKHRIFSDAPFERKYKTYKKLEDMPMWRLVELFGGEEKVLQDALQHFGGVEAAAKAYRKRHGKTLDPESDMFNWCIAGLYFEDKAEEAERQGLPWSIN